MFCKNCGNEMDPNASFCVRCGAMKGVGQKYCANCGAELPVNATACVRCGCLAAGPAPGQAQSGAAQKSKLAAGLLGIFLGSLGIHNFYLGYTGKAVAQLLISVCTLRDRGGGHGRLGADRGHSHPHGLHCRGRQGRADQKGSLSRAA